MKKNLLVLTVISFAGSVFYSVIFKYRITSRSDFSISIGETILFTLIFLGISLVILLPILLLMLFFNKILEKNDFFLRMNFVLVLFLIGYVSLLQIVFFKNIKDSLDLICSYGIVSVFILNFHYYKTKCLLKNEM